MRILVIEDVEAMALALTERLRQHGHHASAVHHLRGAEAALSNGHYEAFTVDNQLPDGRGVKFLRVLRAKAGTSVPIVMVTADTGLETITEAWEAGASAFVSKLSPSALDLVVEAVQGRRVWPEVDPVSLLSDEELDALADLEDDKALSQRAYEIASDRLPPWSRR